MTRFSFCLILTGWLTLIGLFARPVLAQPLSQAEARADLLFLNEKLHELHPGYGYYTPANQLASLYDSLCQSLTTDLDYLQFYRHISPLVAALHDGHTVRSHRKGYFSKTTRFFPFYIRSAGPDYFVSHNMSADTSLRRGTQLLTINGQPIAALHQQLMAADRSGSDGDNLTGRRQASLLQFADYYAAWFGSTDSVRIGYRRQGDTLRRETVLACPTLSQFRGAFMRRYRNDLDRRNNLSVRLADARTHTAVLRVSTFMGPQKHDLFGWTFGRKLRQAFRQIRADSIQNLVVDVQNNGGGMVLNSARLLRYWMPRPFAVMEGEAVRKAARNDLVGRHNPFGRLWFALRYRSDHNGSYVARSGRDRYRPVRQYGFRGKLYFLENGGSFSATATMLAKTLDAGLGTIVGEAGGSAYWGDFAGQFRQVTLPHSQIQVRVPLKKLVHAVRPDRANGFTVEPDFAINRTYDDIVTNRDYALTYTLNLIRQGITARRPAGSPASNRPTVAVRESRTAN